MGADSNIEWTHHTFNPWIGCTHVSPGCAFCYACTLDQRRFSKTLGGATKESPVSHWGKGAPRHRTSPVNWRDPLKWNREWAEANTTVQTSDRPRVFCASLADWLDEEVPVEWRADLLNLIRQTSRLDWLLLTKRPQNFFGCLSDVITVNRDRDLDDFACGWISGQKVPDNVWIGTTVEDQTRADERIPRLLEIPARVRFLSCEPLLGPVNIPVVLERCIGWNPDGSERCWFRPGLPLINWVICGGESGHGARPMQEEWARSLRDQCQAAGVAFFMKQMGGGRDKRGRLEDIPEDLRIREFPKQ